MSYAMVQDSDRVITITREPQNQLKLLVAKARMGEEGWNLWVRAQADRGRFEALSTGRTRGPFDRQIG